MRELRLLVQLPVAVRELRVSFQLPLSPRPDAPCLGGMYEVKPFALPKTHDESPLVRGPVFHYVFGVAKQKKGADIDFIEVLFLSFDERDAFARAGNPRAPDRKPFQASQSSYERCNASTTAEDHLGIREEL
jgi:hypothetical protein